MLSDHSIASLSQSHGMITPFHAESVSKLEDGTPITSSGSSSYGYDLSLGPTYRRLRSQQELAEMGYSFQGKHHVMLVMDPSNFNPIFYGDVENIPDDGLVLMPGEFILSVSNEYIKMPGNISAICMQKSTCARTQLRVEVTPLEAGWSGYVTYEICNPTPHPVLLRKGMGITQALFFVGDQPCATTYEDRGGKYQNQPQEPVIPRSKHQQIKGFPYMYSDKGVIKVGHFTLTETKTQQTRDWSTITTKIIDDFVLKLERSDEINYAAQLVCKYIQNPTASEMLEFLKILTNGNPMIVSKLFALTDGVLVAIANNYDATPEIFDSAVAVAHKSRLKHDRNYSHVEFLALVGSLTDKVKAKTTKTKAASKSEDKTHDLWADLFDQIWRQASGRPTLRATMSEALAALAQKPIAHNPEAMFDFLQWVISKRSSAAPADCLICLVIIVAISGCENVAKELLFEAIDITRPFIEANRYLEVRKEFHSLESYLKSDFHMQNGFFQGANGTTAADIKPKEAEPEVQSDTAAFDRDMAAETEKTKAWYESARQDVSIEEAIKVIAKAVHTDQSYAWSWICNLAMMAQDAGATNVKANKWAGTFMYNLFKYRAWAHNDTFKDHIRKAEKADYQHQTTVMPAFTAEGLRQGFDEILLKDLIAETRSSGTTRGAKPGSTAAKLGIVPVDNTYATERLTVHIDLEPNDPNPQASLQEAMKHVDKWVRSATVILTPENTESVMPRVCEIMKHIRDGKIDTLVIKQA